MSTNPADQNANPDSQPVGDADSSINRIRKLFSVGDTIIIPDRGTITITVDSSRSDFTFTISDADGNLLGDGILRDLDFTVESFHINAQPDVPPKSEQQQ